MKSPETRKARVVPAQVEAAREASSGGGGADGRQAASSSSVAAREAAASLSDVMRRDFAVIVPAFNEAEMVPQLIVEIRRAFTEYDLRGEVILVDDGSTDGTAAAAEWEARQWDALKVLRHRTNLGKTEALQTAAGATDRTYLILFDADLQHLPDEFPRFLAKLQDGWDMVTGRKVGAYDKRHVSSAYNFLSRKIFDVPVSDLNSMKAFRREILDGMHLRHDWHRFFVVLAHARGWSVTEIDVDLYPRRAGISKYSGPFRILVGALDLITVWFLLIFSRKPLLLFGVSGTVLVTLGVVVGLVAFYLRLFHIATPFGYRPFLDLVILLETLGFLLLGIGLVAEMVAQLRDEVDALRRQR
jgi:glycosyltransferase involved in cell wall biosynthesis